MSDEGLRKNQDLPAFRARALATRAQKRPLASWWRSRQQQHQRAGPSRVPDHRTRKPQHSELQKVVVVEANIVQIPARGSGQR